MRAFPCILQPTKTVLAGLRTRPQVTFTVVWIWGSHYDAGISTHQAGDPGDFPSELSVSITSAYKQRWDPPHWPRSCSYKGFLYGGPRRYGVHGPGPHLCWGSGWWWWLW